MSAIRFVYGIQVPYKAVCRYVWRTAAVGGDHSDSGYGFLIYCPDESLVKRVQEHIWTLENTGFTPIYSRQAPELYPRCFQEAPVLISSQAPDPSQDGQRVLINMSDEPISQPERFAGVVELVGQDDNNKDRARQKVAVYRDQQGLAVEFIAAAQILT